MNDNINNYSFSFKKEAEELRRGLGAKADNIIFAEVDIQNSHYDAPQIDVTGLIGHQKAHDLVKSVIVQRYTHDPERSSMQDLIGGFNVICFRKSDAYTDRLGEPNKPQMRLFTLYHETGHTLIPGPDVDEDHPFQECAADAYAAIRFFQRFGREAAPFLSQISWSRAAKAVTYLDSSHLTTPVLDRIIADGSRRDFSKLTSDETIALARHYAQEVTPKASVLSETRSIFARAMVDDKIDFSRLYATCLATSNDFSFYIGAKFFQPFLQPEGVVMNGQTIQIDDPYRQQYAQALRQRGDKCRQNIFNDAATLQKEPAHPFTEALKVSRPAGQKKFILNI